MWRAGQSLCGELRGVPKEGREAGSIAPMGGTDPWLMYSRGRKRAAPSSLSPKHVNKTPETPQRCPRDHRNAVHQPPPTKMLCMRQEAAYTPWP